HFTYDVIVGIGDEDVAAAVHGHAVRRIQLGRGGEPPVTAVAGRAVPGKREDVSGCLDDFADDMVVDIGNEDVAAAVHGHAIGGVQLGRGGGPAVAAVTCGAGAGDGEDIARRLHQLANDVVVEIGDEDIAVAVHGHAGRIIELGCRRRAA